MRQMLGLVLGLYLTVAIAVFGGAAYGFMSGEHHKYATCPNENWTPWALYRAVAWPKAYFDEHQKVSGIDAWLIVQYDPFAETCG